MGEIPKDPNLLSGETIGSFCLNLKDAVPISDSRVLKLKGSMKSHIRSKTE